MNFLGIPLAEAQRRGERKNIKISSKISAISAISASLREVFGKISILAILMIAGSLSLSAQTLSGSLDTKLTVGTGAGTSPQFVYGAEEYANLRLRIPAGEYAVVYGAFNLIAAVGSSATHIDSTSGIGLISGYSMEENYLAVMELERLYVQISGDTFGLSAGLLRIPFGYGLVWGPMDFLNPHNPIEPEARLRGVLGGFASYFPEQLPDMKFLVFAAAPQNPFSEKGNGARFGLSWDNHWQKASAQLLYCFESPSSSAVAEYAFGLHRVGLSFKADLEIGLVAELLYTINPDSLAGTDGLAASAGVDYSFFDGKLYVLAEYLYLGNAESHGLYAAGTWKLSDFSSITLGCSALLQVFSCTAIASWQYEFIQGMVLSVRVIAPFDKDSFNASVTTGLKVKF